MSTMERCPEHMTPFQVLLVERREDRPGEPFRLRTLCCPLCATGGRSGLYQDWERIEGHENGPDATQPALEF